MFSGIVSDVGIVLETGPRSGGLDLEIGCSYRDLEPGESVSVDGACLTVEQATAATLKVHVVPSTLGRTHFGDYQGGRRVNLERALRVGERLSGHLVQGHVDGLGMVDRISEGHDTWLMDLLVPAEIARICVPLGSITVDGVSLTVNAKPGRDLIQISLIPFTLQHTTLGERRVGDRIHLEGDMIGKYVAFLVEERFHGVRET